MPVSRQERRARREQAFEELTGVPWEGTPQPLASNPQIVVILTRTAIRMERAENRPDAGIPTSVNTGGAAGG